MTTLELTSGDLKLVARQLSDSSFGFTSAVRSGGMWREASAGPSRPIDSLPASQCSFAPDSAGLVFKGNRPGMTWRCEVSPQAGGFWLETVLHVETAMPFLPALLIWIGKLDPLEDRQAHTWRQTILRAPTTNQGGLPGNDLPACYVYDLATRLETICYFPPDAFAWMPNRFCELTMREVFVYQPVARYGLGLLPIPSAPEALVELPAGRHVVRWWFTQRGCDDVPTPWEAQRRLVDAITPLLDPIPSPIDNALAWDEMAMNTLVDLRRDPCWIEIDNRRGLRAYVRGSSSLKRDEARGFELMTLLDVAWPLLLWRDAAGGNEQADALFRQVRPSLEAFHRPVASYIANGFPPRAGDTWMDTWYFLENALIKWPWVAYLTRDAILREMFFDALQGATTLAHNTNYVFPLFADASDWQPRNSLLNVSVGGLYAAGHVLAHQMNPVEHHLSEAANAIRVMHHLPPHMLTHEPQQLTFAAAAARYLGKALADARWSSIAADFVYLVLRMGYWAADPAVPFYDPRGMFQACASLCYPAYKENVECLIAWPELMRDNIGPIWLMATFANLQRKHNLRFFDPFLPVELRRGPCAYIPYEDLATSEFSHTAELGKELYGAGEVFWSALLFDVFGRTDDPRILCLCLDVPCLELGVLSPGSGRQFLLLNPASTDREVHVRAGQREMQVAISARSICHVEL